MGSTKSAEVTKLDPERFNHIVAHATIRDIKLVGTKFDLKPEAMALGERWDFQLGDALEDWACDNENGLLHGTFAYVAACVQGRRKLLSVTCRYFVTYKLSDLCDEGAGQHYLTRVGRFAAYPYFRTIFATLTQQSGVMLPPLPVISDGPRWVNSPAAAEKALHAKKGKEAAASDGEADD